MDLSADASPATFPEWISPPLPRRPDPPDGSGWRWIARDLPCLDSSGEASDAATEFGRTSTPRGFEARPEDNGDRARELPGAGVVGSADDEVEPAIAVQVAGRDGDTEGVGLGATGDQAEGPRR